MEIKTMEETISQTKKTNIWLWVLMVVVILIVVGIVWWQVKKITMVPKEGVEIPKEEAEVPSVSEEKELPSDTTEEILKEVENVEALDLEKEFQEIDQDLNSL